MTPPRLMAPTHYPGSAESNPGMICGRRSGGLALCRRPLRARIRRVWVQRRIVLGSRPRGFHLVTDEIERGVPELRELRLGIATVFMQHTSASLTLNENASPDVRRDFAAWFDHAVPDGAEYFAHTLEGPDDMPAHIKTSLTGSSLVIPIARGSLALGTWQGIYLGEHRERGGPRRVVF